VNDRDKTKEQLLEEIAELRERLAALEADDSQRPQGERWARSILDVLPLGIHECDVEGKITYVNPAQEAITGYSAEELLGTRACDRIEPASERQAQPAILKRLAAEQPPPSPYIVKNTRKNGEVFDIRVDWNYVRNDRGEVTGFLSVITDVTEQKRIEKALRQSETRYRGLAESTTDMIYITDRDGVILYANLAAAACYNCDPNSIAGRRQSDLFPPEVAEEHLASVAKVFETGAICDEDRVYRFGTQEVWLNNRLMPLRDDQGEVTAAIGVSRNITPRKQAEAALKEAHDELEKRVEERTAELARAKREWEWTFDSVPDLVAVLDPSSRIVRVNRAMAERLGLPPEQCVGLRCCETVHGRSEPPEFCPNALTLTDGKGHAVEMHEERLGGDYLVSTTPIFDESNRLIGSVHVARDITEQKRAQKALKESEEKYRGLVDICPDAIVVSDLTGRSVFVSPQTWKLLNLPKETELVGRSTLDFVIEPDRPRLAARIESLLKVGKQEHTEYTTLRPDGTTVPVELSSAVIRDADGNPTALVAIIRDISERKRAQEQLRQSEEKYRRLVELCPDAVVMTDLTARAIYVSPQTRKLLNVSDDVELVGQDVSNYLIEADRPRLAENLVNLIVSGSQKHQQYTGLRPDGTTVPTEISSAVVRDGKGAAVALMAIVRDISDRKQAEEALRQSEEKYRNLVDLCPDTVMVTDLDANTLFISQQAWKLLGLPENVPLVGRNGYDLVVESDRARLADRIAELIHVGKQKHIEYTVLSPTGQTIPVEISSSVIPDSQGKPVALMAVVRDISDRKRAEAALKKEHRTLRHLLESSDHERRLIAYDIHDGPAQQLAGAIMQLDTYHYQKEARPNEADKAYDAAVTMLRQAHFEIRRLISGVRPPILDESGIVAAVAHLVNEHRMQTGPTIEFHSDVSFDRLVPTLENAIYRIVQEGLANACKYSKSPKIRVELVQREDSLRIRVQDWGVGFDPRHVRDDRFGLEGIRERARLLGGKALIETVAQQGTCLSVELPLAFRKESEQE
jgi:PAS domain S-box-containing protein